MPRIVSSSYKAPVWLRGGHTQSIYPSFFRSVTAPELSRIRIDTPDGDFLDVDFGYCGRPTQKAVILSHGLEGHSRRKYILGMGRAFMRYGWDMIAWNCRFCSDEQNILPRMYHSGDSADLRAVVEYARCLGYTGIVLAGFSMGGNQTLKFLGEEGSKIATEILASVNFSVPCNLAESANALSKPSNRLFMVYFMHTLRKKIRKKNQKYPESFDITGLDKMKTFREFDDKYTAPLHGFESAEDYWHKSSSMHFLSDIKIPTLLVNAKNDPFMSPGCYPENIAINSEVFFLETPNEGGHVGFSPAQGFEAGYAGGTSLAGKGSYWSENRALEFVTGVLGGL